MPAILPRLARIFSPSSRLLLFAAGGALIGAVAFSYWSTLRAPFVFDDFSAVVTNPTIRQWSTAWLPLKDGRSTGGRPVVNFSFAANYAVGGENPAGYHAANLCLHALAALLVFGLVRRTLLTSRVSERFQNAATPLAFFVALLWAVHPLATESVTPVAQRTESLFGLLLLATLYGFARGAAASRPAPWWGLSFFACLLGMGVKETMATAPLLVVLYDRAFYAGSLRGAWRERRNYYLALAATWLALAWLVLGGGGTRGTAAGLGLGVSSWDYLLKQSEAIVLYLKLCFWPFPLVIDYGTAVVTSWREVWWQSLLVLALLMGAGWSGWRRPTWGFLGAWFFILLAPSSSFVPLVAQTMAEHRMYLPLAAVIAGAVLVGYARCGGPAAWFGLALAACAALGTIQRNAVYRSELSLWRDTADHYPKNPRAQSNYAIALAEAGDLPAAIVHYEQALKLGYRSVRTELAYCAALLRVGRIAEAVAHGEAAVRLDPSYLDAQVNLANALALTDRPEAAVTHYERALQLDPRAADVHAYLGELLLRLRQTAAAISHLQEAVALEPGRAQAWYDLARASQQQRDPANARRAAEYALQLKPDFPEALHLLGSMEAASGNFAAAILRFRRATELAPGYFAARNNLANALLLTGQRDAAIVEYRKILQEHPDDRSVQENLARALEFKP